MLWFLWTLCGDHWLCSHDCGIYVIQNMRSARDKSQSLDSNIPTAANEVEVIILCLRSIIFSNSCNFAACYWVLLIINGQTLSQEIRENVLLWMLNHDCNVLSHLVRVDATEWYEKEKKGKRKCLDGGTSAGHGEDQTGWKPIQPSSKRHK